MHSGQQCDTNVCVLNVCYEVPKMQKKEVLDLFKITPPLNTVAACDGEMD